VPAHIPAVPRRSQGVRSRPKFARLVDVFAVIHESHLKALGGFVAFEDGPPLAMPQAILPEIFWLELLHVDLSRTWISRQLAEVGADRFCGHLIWQLIKIAKRPTGVSDFPTQRSLAKDLCAVAGSTMKSPDLNCARDSSRAARSFFVSGVLALGALSRRRSIGSGA